MSLWPSSETLKVGNMNGKYFENFCINQLTKKFMGLGVSPKIFYYRDIDQKEVDVVLENHEGLTPIEIKMTSNPHIPDVSVFKELTKFGKVVSPGAILCTIDKPLLVVGDNVLLPVDLI